MKKLFLLCFILSFGLMTGLAQNYSLEINATGFESEGTAYVLLFKEGQAFKATSKLCVKKKAAIVDGEISVLFNELQKGSYAAMVYHDQNKNRKMDTNFIGMPKEGVGRSNTYKGMPSFRKSQFRVDRDKNITISMKYL